MATISVTDTVAEKIRLLAAAWDTTDDQVVYRLLEEFLAKRQTSAVADAEGTSRVAVHATYDGQRVEGEFEPQTGRLIITNGPLAGRAFRSPSGAAIAVVQKLNPTVQPNRNGWTFWIITETGQTLNTKRRSFG